ncbi:hypothetical protein U9M48_001052 [Paspalum notatum var. saurae]|uniref:F-box domain-containing protein n=1 Tax=Paspalum notatum var. saurae TaxID=547442 RepID=A0AAQ3PHQ7_PASNO
MELESQRKHRRLDNDDDAGDGAVCSAGDPLSTLPDCLLHDILSRLKARQVVQTSVLSRRWSSLWRSVPCLDVDQDEFTAAAAPGDDTAKECWGRFERFTDHLLIRRNVGVVLLDSFRLSVGDPWWCDQAARWIWHIVKHGAQDHHRHPSPAATTTLSWNLKMLHLSNVSVDDRLAEHIRSRCPSLQEVQLKGCRCDMRQITSRSLRKLLLQDCDCTRLSAITSPKLERLAIYGGRVTGDGPLAVVAPSLVYLVYLGLSVPDCPGGVHLDEMPSLGHAFVDVWGATVTPLGQNVSGIDYYRLLGSVSSVAILELEVECFVAVESAVLPQFKNLRVLSVRGCKQHTASFEMLLLRHFLRSSPNLELLAVHYCEKDSTGTEEIDTAQYRIAEIRYKEEEYLLQQVRLLLNDPQDTVIKLIKVSPMGLESVENFPCEYQSGFSTCTCAHNEWR